MRLPLAFATLAMMSASALADGAPNDTTGYSSGSSAMQTAAMLVKTGRYEDAIPKLQKLVFDEPKNPDVFNLLGFSLRKTGDLENAGVAYERALALDSRHLGALEYQGELFLMLGQVEKAEANLERLDSLCFFGCDQEKQLKAAIADWRAKNGA